MTRPAKSIRRHAEVFTTGEIRQICSVAIKTVMKWIDSGELEGYRIPCSRDRRVPRSSLVRFLHQKKMPIPDWLAERRELLCVTSAVAISDRIAAVLSGTWNVAIACSLFGAGQQFTAARPRAVLLDFSLGRTDCVAACTAMLAVNEPPAVLALAAEDETDIAALLASGFGNVWVSPYNLASVAAYLEENTP